MAKRDSGFSMIELLVVILIIAIVATFTIPQAMTSVRAYRFHSDAQALAATLDVARLRATSQFVPYRVNLTWVWTGGTWVNAYTLERLCGSMTSGCTAPWTPVCTQPYWSQSTPQIEAGTQYLAVNNNYSWWNPGGTASYPGPIIPGSTPVAWAGTPGVSATLPFPYGFYFNTRGMPVGCDGNPLPNGGEVIYLWNPNLNISDAITVSVGGRISVYQWVPDPVTGLGKWVRR